MKRLLILLMVVLAAPVMAQVSVDFDSLTVGAVDTNNITSPTLNELNAATTGGTWSFFGGTRGNPYIRADAGGSDQALEISATSVLGGLTDWAGRLDFDTPVLVSSLGSDYLEITFTTATKTSTGFIRNYYWYIKDGSTTLVTMGLDDGFVLLNGSNIGQITGNADQYSVDPWDSTAGPIVFGGTTNDIVFDVSVKIYGDGSVDVSWAGRTGASSTTGSLIAGTVSTSANVGRIEMNYNLGGSKVQAVYISSLDVTSPSPPPPESNQKIPSEENELHKKNSLWP